MSKDFGDYFTPSDDNGSCSSPLHTACIAVILFNTLIENNVIVAKKSEESNTKKCKWNKDKKVPKDYEEHPLSADATHCVFPYYRYGEYVPNPLSKTEEIKMSIIKAANCIVSDEERGVFDPGHIHTKIAASIYRYKKYLINGSPNSTEYIL